MFVTLSYVNLVLFLPILQGLMYNNPFTKIDLNYLTFELWGYSFYVTLCYSNNLFPYNVAFVRRVVC